MYKCLYGSVQAIQVDIGDTYEANLDYLDFPGISRDPGIYNFQSRNPGMQINREK